MDTKQVLRVIGRELKDTLRGYGLFFLAYLRKLIPWPFSLKQIVEFPLWATPLVIVFGHPYFPAWLKLVSAGLLGVWVFFMAREIKKRLATASVSRRAGIRGAILAVFIPFFLVAFTCLNWGLSEVTTNLRGEGTAGPTYLHDPLAPDSPEPNPWFFMKNAAMPGKGSYDTIALDGVAYWNYTIYSTLGVNLAGIFEPLGITSPGGKVPRLETWHTGADILEAVLSIITSILFLGILGDIALTVQRKIQTGTFNRDLDLTRDHAVDFLSSIRGLNSLLEVDNAVEAFQQTKTVLAHGVDELIRRLRDDDPQVRATAALVLGKLGEERAFSELRRRLEDPSIRVRAAALTGLANLIPQKAAKYLKGALTSNDPTLARTAALVTAEVAGQLQASESDQHRLRDALVDCLEAEDSDIRAGVARLLTLFEPEPTWRAILDRYDQADASDAWRAGALLALGKLAAPEALPKLLSAAKSATPELREAALRALGAWDAEHGGEEIHATLTKAIADDDRNARLAAIKALAKHGTAPDFPKLTAVLRDGALDAATHMEIAHTLGLLAQAARAAGETVPEEVFEALKEKAAVREDSVLRDEVCLALARIGDANARPILESLLPDPEAAQALGILGDPAAIDALAKAAEATQAAPATDFARLAPIDALGWLGPQATQALIAIYEDRYEDRDNVARSLGRIVGQHGPEAATEAEAFLLREFKPGDLATVTRFAPALALCNTPGARDALISVLKRNASPRARAAAARGLGEIGDPEAIDALVKHAKHDEPEVRDAVFGALRQFDTGILPGRVLTALTSHARGLAHSATAFLRAATGLTKHLVPGEPGLGNTGAASDRPSRRKVSPYDLLEEYD